MCWSIPAWAFRSDEHRVPHGHQALDGYLLPVNLAAGATSPRPAGGGSRSGWGAAAADGGGPGPGVCAGRPPDPRWGSEECFGEDPVLAARMAQAAVRGSKAGGVDVVAKHLCAQGETTGGVNASAARIGPRELGDPPAPVRACVEAGVAGFMAAYNEIDGVYCHANRWALTELLGRSMGSRALSCLTAWPLTSWTP